MYFQMAWRNIWRNPRRTTVILVAVIIGVWSMILLGALARGMIINMLENGISTLTGDIQIHGRGYRDDPSVEKSMYDSEILKTGLKSVLPPGAAWAPRVRVNAIASNARHSAGITLVGIDPSMEANVSFIGHAVSEGRYLKQEEKNGVIVGRALLDKFETDIGKKLVFMSQDTGNEIASRAFRIVGVYRADMEASEKQFAFVNLPAARKMLKMGNGISEVSIILPGHDDLSGIAGRLKEALPETDFEVHTWSELLPLLKAYLTIFDDFMYIWFLVTFIAMGFGIVNTTLMAVFERMREFGLLKALGMKPWWIIREVLLESILLLFIGIIAGNIFAYFCIWVLSGSGIDVSALAAGAEYFGMSRVIFPVLAVKDVIVANMTVLILGLLVCIYPAAKAARFTAVEAMAHT